MDLKEYQKRVLKETDAYLRELPPFTHLNHTPVPTSSPQKQNQIAGGILLRRGSDPDVRGLC